MEREREGEGRREGGREIVGAVTVCACADWNDFNIYII
jgi:hypothetical protein